MGSKRALYFVLCLVIAACETVSAAGKKQQPLVKVLAASVQRTLPGIPGAAIKTNYYFAVVWQSVTPPDKFYWKGDTGWWNCGVAKAHKTTPKSNSTDGYASEPITTENIRKGDTLLISASRQIKQDLQRLTKARPNTLCYTAGNTIRGQVRVKNIVRKQDLAMP